MKEWENGDTNRCVSCSEVIVWNGMNWIHLNPYHRHPARPKYNFAVNRMSTDVAGSLAAIGIGVAGFFSGDFLLSVLGWMSGIGGILGLVYCAWGFSRK